MSWETVLVTALGTGVAGWWVENALYGPRYSWTFGGARVPFLPVYATGGAAIALLEPVLRGEGWAVRGLTYGIVLTAIEGASGIAERSLGRVSWDYNGRPVDVPHAMAWAGLGLLAENVVRRF